jgi:hypothetical protein
MLIVAVQMQKWFPFALSSSYKIFRTALGSMYLLSCACIVPYYFCPILTDFGVS